MSLTLTHGVVITKHGIFNPAPSKRTTSPIDSVHCTQLRFAECFSLYVGNVYRVSRKGYV